VEIVCDAVFGEVEAPLEVILEAQTRGMVRPAADRAGSEALMALEIVDRTNAVYGVAQEEDGRNVDVIHLRDGQDGVVAGDCLVFRMVADEFFEFCGRDAAMRLRAIEGDPCFSEIVLKKVVDGGAGILEDVVMDDDRSFGGRFHADP